MTAQEEPDEILVKRVKKGDTSAFTILVERYERMAYSIASRYVDRETAYDVAQQTFVKAWEKRLSIKSGEAFAKWIATIATHQAIDALRSSKKHPTPISFEGLLDEGGEYKIFASNTSDPEHRVLHTELIDELRKELQEKLSMRQWQCIELYLEGYETDDIAQATGIKKSCVPVYISKARRIAKEFAQKERNREEIKAQNNNEPRSVREVELLDEIQEQKGDE